MEQHSKIIKKWTTDTCNNIDESPENNSGWKNKKSPKATWGFPGGSDGKESNCNVGDPAPNPGSARSPGEGNGNPLQYSCLENPTDRGAWLTTVHGVPKSHTQLND